MTKSTFHIFYYNILTIQWHFRNSRFTSEWMHYFFLWSDQKLRCVKVQTESTQAANRWLRICSTEGQRTRLLCSTTATRQHLLTTQSITLVRSVVAVKRRGWSQNPPEIKWLILKKLRPLHVFTHCCWSAARFVHQVKVSLIIRYHWTTRVKAIHTDESMVFSWSCLKSI